MNMTYIKARHGAGRFFRGAPQLLELKQLVEMESRFRGHCRDTIRRYRAWKGGGEGGDDLMEKHYREIEGRLLRRQAQDAVRLYALVRRDVRRQLNKYIGRIAGTKF